VISDIKPTKLKNDFGFMYNLLGRGFFYLYLGIMMMGYSSKGSYAIDLWFGTSYILLLFTAVSLIIAGFFYKGAEKELSKPLKLSEEI